MVGYVTTHLGSEDVNDCDNLIKEFTTHNIYPFESINQLKSLTTNNKKILDDQRSIFVKELMEKKQIITIDNMTSTVHNIKWSSTIEQKFTSLAHRVIDSK